jgi:hypothetical protein
MVSPALKLARRRRLLERQWPWFVALALGAGMLAAFVLALDAGRLAAFEDLESVVRGYTAVGVLLGAGAVLLSGLSFLYSLRKRGLQERLPLGRSTLATWLWSHVYLGLFALVLAAGHAGYGLLNANVSTGKLLFALLAALVGSGVLWRLVYVVVPPVAARNVGNYSVAASHARAEACLVEIEKLAAGGSARLRELKAWVLGRTPTAAELAQASASLPVEERAAWSELATLSATRLEALGRERRQVKYVRLLQGLRVLHVPLALAFVLAVPVHVLFAYHLPARLLDPVTMGGAALDGFEPSATCADCHRPIYDAWRNSMHAHAMTSPIMIAQTNQVAARVLRSASAPDPKEACVACHGPIGTLLTEGNTLPLPAGKLSDRALLDDGVGCAVCHQWQGTPRTASAALTPFQAGFEAGHTYYGPFGDAVGNAFHRSARSPLFAHPDELCKNCHSVELDKNRDGHFERGTDLVLQTLYEEWEQYAKAGGASCVDCHMPALGKAQRAAASAAIPFEQDREAPVRAARDHAFVGVDYPLDDRKAQSALAAKREALLASAGTLAIVPESFKKRPASVTFAVSVANTGTGHYLPGGFAFVRQMWVEAIVTDAAGTVIASSGKLEHTDDDLCDATIVDDAESPMRPFINGCRAADPALVNFQQMLVDKVEVLRDASGAIRTGSRGERLLARAQGSKEAVIQELDGGPVPRTRKATGKPTPPLAPGETATFPYELPVTGGGGPAHLRVRLLFRVAPAYFLRALGREQPPAEEPRLEKLVSELSVTEMARADADL